MGRRIIKILIRNMQKYPRSEWLLFYGSFAAVIIACALMAPWSKHFLPNFLFFLAAPVTSGVGLLFFRPALSAGASLGFCIGCICFDAWVGDDAMGWLIYLISLPAPFLVCFALPRAVGALTLWKVFAFSIVSVSAAMYINFLLVDNIL